MIKKVIFAALALAVMYSCTKEDGSSSSSSSSSGSGLYQQISSSAMPDPDEDGNIIPDFSRVGYQWGDEAIPTVAVVKTLYPLGIGEDATSMIQDAIDEVAALPESERGAILLTAGEYRVSSTLYIKANGIVLRGVGNGEDYNTNTVLYYTATSSSDFIEIGNTGSLSYTKPSVYNIKDDYVPVGRFWVRVSDASSFSVGQNVCIYYDMNMDWVSAIEMDAIPGTGVTQWSSALSSYKFTPERYVTKISGDTLWFENPFVMELSSEWGGGFVAPCSYSSGGRVSECGVEDLFVKSYYRSSTDNEHGFSAINIEAAEHCWVRNVNGKHFAYALVFVDSKGKNITVENCQHTEPKSEVTGGYRYTFTIGGQLCLVKDCYTSEGRHSYNASPRNSGPNVYVNCSASLGQNDDGPHHRWNMGTLYDNLTSDDSIAIEDRSSYGSGHGWAGVNNVLWNCTYAVEIVVQSPQDAGKNYSIGSVGPKGEGYVADRPDGEWISQGAYVTPQSLYYAQKELRDKLQPGGVFDVD